MSCRSDRPSAAGEAHRRPRELPRKQAERHDALRAYQQLAALITVDVAVPAEAEGGNVHRFDHRPPRTNDGAVDVELRLPFTSSARSVVVRRCRRSGRRSTRQIGGADDARRRAGENGLDRPETGGLAIDHGPITLDHRQRGENPARREDPSTARINRSINGMSRALRTQVTALRGAFKREVSSCEQVTGSPVSSRRIAAARSS